MDNNQAEAPIPVSAVPIPPPVQVPMLCPQCYQPVLPTYHFCPNCGKKLTEAGLSTDVVSQILLYGFSIVLPIICYLAVSYWQGIKYIKSADPKAQQIGWIALALLIISSVITFWTFGVWIDQFIKAQTSTVGLSADGI
jgi:hypothetical protein